jgi:hypothetical protein
MDFLVNCQSKIDLLNKIFIYFVLSILICFLSCSIELENDIIAKIDDVAISESEFQLRYNFNPYLKDIVSQKKAKKIVLSSLIAEKILFLESNNHNSPSEQLLELRDQYLVEAMIEQLRQDSIESQIKISDEELKQEYSKSIKEIDIKFVAFSSLEEAKKVRKEIDETGSYDKPIRKYMNLKGWQKEQIPTKKIVWTKENYELEQSVYDLSPGETSDPVFAHNEYYLIHVTNIASLSEPNQKDFKDRLPALQDRIRRFKIKNKYSLFFENHIRNNMGNVDWNVFRDIVDVMVSEVQFNKEAQMSDQNKPLSEIGYISLLDRIRQNMDQELIEFPDGKTWSIKNVLKKMNIGPYVFNFKNETLFRRSCARNLELLQEHNAIYEIAKNKGYENNKFVKRQFNMWNTFYSSGEFRHSLLDKTKIIPTDSVKYLDSKLSLLQNKRLTTFDEFLTEISSTYKININKKLFDSIKLNKQDMVVVKSHFANRLIAPPLEPLSALQKWSNKFNSILNQNNIH